VSEVLAHDPCPDEIDAFLGRVQAAWDERHGARKGSTTEGSALSPAPIRTVLGVVPQPRCPFQGLKERTKGIVSAVAAERQRLAPSKPPLQRGRPSPTEKAARRLARQSPSMQETIRDGCQERVLFVTRPLTRSERQRLLDSTRGLPPLRKRREIMAPIEAVFDRRCRTPTALRKLRKLRHWVKRFPWMGHT